jgi:GT2 family glycosyltransferase
MYGEDVELSYRFREKGYSLRYVPDAVVYHYTYASPNEVKPAQFSGSIIANALIRFRYGGVWDKFSVFPLQFFLVFRGGGFEGSRILALKSQLKIMRLMPFFWNSRKANDRFPFYGFNYEKNRHGSFYVVGNLPEKKPVVSIVTRTYKGREALLKECIMSVLNQTYPVIEHIVVEDGGDTMKPLIEDIQARYPAHRIIHHAAPRKGRAYAGNQGMKMAKGQYLLFLDDDDLLFSDHVEVLAGELLADDKIDAAYSLAWEVETAFDSDGGYWEYDHKTDPVFFQEFDRNLLMHHNYIPIQSILFKRELYEKYGGFDLEMDFLEDWNLWSRYALHAVFKFVPKTTSMFRTPHDVEIRMRRKKQLDQAYPDAVARLRKVVDKQPGRSSENRAK